MASENITCVISLLSSLATLLASVEGNECRQVGFKSDETHKILINHVISNFTVQTNQMCRFACYPDPDCVSYNVGPSQTPGMMVCQLNDADRRQYPQDYQDRPGYFYGQWKQNLCQSSPCPVNSTCQHGFTAKRYRCICPFGRKGEHCEAETESLSIEVESVGKDSVNGTLRTAMILVNGKNYFAFGRGHNLAAFHMNGEFISKAKFDTFGNPAAGANMSDYINNLPGNTIVIVTVNDSGQRYVVDAHQALLSIGAQPPLTPNGLRATWCLIGHKGSSRPWIAQDQKDRYYVVAKVSAKIYLEQ